MKCKLCNQDRDLIKAHIIPRSLYKPLLEEGKPLSVLSSSPATHPQKSRIGFYDTEILCQECERIFSPWDDYAQKTLLSEPKQGDYFIHNGQKLAFKMEIDYVKLKLFFISLLWRAGISNLYFFKKIQIAPFEDQLKEMILKGDPGNPETFAIALAKFNEPLGTIMLDPHNGRFKDEGINYCRFYLAGYVAFIKTDKRPYPDRLKEIILSSDRPLYVILRDLRNSKEFPLMRKVARMWSPQISK
jgi:hypothetical protein